MIHPLPSTTAAAAIEKQRVYAALVLNHPHRLFIANAASASVARLLEDGASHVYEITKSQLPVSELRPLPPNDPQVLVSF